MEQRLGAIGHHVVSHRTPHHSGQHRVEVVPPEPIGMVVVEMVQLIDHPLRLEKRGEVHRVAGVVVVAVVPGEHLEDRLRGQRRQPNGHTFRQQTDDGVRQRLLPAFKG